jgi:hypothetical protein
MTVNGVDILQRKISTFIDDGRQVFYDEINRETAKDASRGFDMPTGNLRYRIVELSANRIRNIAKKAIEVVNELAEKRVLVMTIPSKQPILDAIMTELSKEASLLSAHADNWLANAPLASNLGNIITESVTRARTEADIELDILINTKTTNEVNSVFNIYNYGTANNIQAGHNNNITYVESEKSEKLVSALMALLEQIKVQEVSSLPSGLTTSLEETVVELQRPGNDKNSFKIQSSLMMAMTTLQTLPALKPAVATLATAYDYYFGTSLSTVFS